MHPVSKEYLIALLADAIDSHDVATPSPQALELARAVVSLVQDRDGRDCLLLTPMLNDLAAAFRGEMAKSR